MTAPTEVHGIIAEAPDPKAAGPGMLYFTPEDATPGTAPTATAVSRRQDQLLLKDAKIGDHVDISVDATATPIKVVQVSGVSRTVSDTDRGWAMVASFLAYIVILAIATGGPFWNFAIGMDKRVSNSQTQFMIWFGAVVVVYGAATVLRVSHLGFGYVGGVNIGANLLALSGLSALSFGGAKVVAGQKQDSANQAAADQAKQAGVAAPTPQPVKAPGKPRLADLVQDDDKNADLGDLQMMVVTLAAAIVFLLSAYHFLGTLALQASITLPDIDSTLLGAFGIGQGAYLVKKAAMPQGKG